MQWSTITEGHTEALRSHLSDGGLVELMICIARYLAIGQLIFLRELDLECAIEGSALFGQA